MKPTVMRLLGAFLPNKEEGINAGATAAASVVLIMSRREGNRGFLDSFLRFLL